eukprot:m.160448 g.160448  ORF g.160448 m.160448 type:complete len:138 (+) comp16361_c0_seq3:196-609(+)
MGAVIVIPVLQLLSRSDDAGPSVQAAQLDRIVVNQQRDDTIELVNQTIAICFGKRVSQSSDCLLVTAAVAFAGFLFLFFSFAPARLLHHVAAPSTRARPCWCCCCRVLADACLDEPASDGRSPQVRSQVSNIICTDW